MMKVRICPAPPGNLNVGAFFDVEEVSVGAGQASLWAQTRD